MSSEYRLILKAKAPYIDEDGEFMFFRRGLYRYSFGNVQFNPSQSADYSETFTLTDQSGWTADWTTQVLSGSGSFDITSEEARMVFAASNSTLAADLDALTIDNAIIAFDVRFNSFSNDIQPTFHFRTQGNWEGERMIGYFLWLYNDKLHLGETNIEYVNDIISETGLSISADTTYRCKISTRGKLHRFKIYSGAEPDWQLTTIDTQHTSGAFNLKLATTGQAAGAEIMYIDNVTVTFKDPVPVIDSIDERDTKLVVNYTGITGADSYEYRVDGGAETDIGTTNPFEITSLTNGKPKDVEMRAIKSGVAGDWGNMVTGTPTNVEIQINQGSYSYSFKDVVLTEQVAGSEPAEWFSDATIASNDSNLKDREALAKLYNDCGGTGWDNQTGWSGDPAQIDLSAGNEPFGVFASTINSERRVTKIRLNNNGTGSPQTDIADRNGNGLTGQLPHELGNLKELLYFDVISNQLTGRLPGGMRYCTKIQRAYFECTKGYNSGQIIGDGALDWGEVTEPEERKRSLDGGKLQDSGDWFYNNFSGRLPGEWSDWNDIRQVLLGATAVNTVSGEADIENCITGPLPPEWGQWNTVRQLILSINAITGKLPPEWAGMTEVVDLWLSGNQLGSQTAGHENAVLPSEWGGGTAFGGGMRKLRHLTMGTGVSGVSSSWYFGGTQTSTFDGPFPENWVNMKMLHKWILPNVNAKIEPPNWLNSGNLHNRAYQTPDWTGTNDDGDTSPNPDATNPIEGWMPGLTSISGYEIFLSMPDPSKLTYLSRFVANGSSFNEQIPQNLDSWSRNLQFLVKSCGLTGPFPDVTSWNDCKIFEIASNNFGGSLPDVPTSNNADWKNVQAQNCGFMGSIPSSWGQLTQSDWIRLWLDNNNLSGAIPTGLANDYSSEFRVNGNKYVFADIIPIIDAGVVNFVYSPQQKFGSQSDYDSGTDTIDFSGSVSHGNNNYQWKRNGSNISGSSASRDVSGFNSGDDIKLVVTNSSAPDLTLESVTITL